MKVKVVVLPKRDFNYKLKLALNGGCKKRFEFFWALALEKTQIRHDLSPLLSRIFCRSLLFVDDLFSVCFQERLCISFSRCSSLDIRLYTYVFSCSLPHSFRRILPILVPSLTFLRVFLDSLYVFYFLFFFLVARSLSFHPIFTQNPLSANLNYNNFLPWTRLWLCRYCCFASWSEIAKYWELLYNFNLTSLISHLQNAGCKLFAYAASHLLAHVKPSCNA